MSAIAAVLYLRGASEERYVLLPADVSVAGMPIVPLDRYGREHATSSFEAVLLRGAGRARVAAPFIISYGGTGQYVYIGLFERTDDALLSLKDAAVIDRRDKIYLVSLDAGEDADTLALHLLTRCPIPEPGAEPGAGTGPIAPLEVGLSMRGDALAVTYRHEEVDTEEFCENLRAQQVSP